jgi:hypothetical protein
VVLALLHHLGGALAKKKPSDLNAIWIAAI